MPKTILLDEFHLIIRISTNLPRAATTTISRELDDEKFILHLRTAIREVFRTVKELAPYRVSLSR